jgi:drug/metabolite transporter (DMT)-like permease
VALSTLEGVERWLSTERNVRVCAIAGAVTIAFSSILVRLSHASPSTAAIFRCVYALPVLGLLAYGEDRRLGRRSWRDRRAALGAGVFFTFDLILWHHSIGDVGAGLATVLANVQVVLVPLVAWAVLSERPGRRVLAALPIALLGVLLISGVLEHGAYGRDPARGAVFGLGAGVAYVGFLLLLRQGGSDLSHRTMGRARHLAAPDARRPIHRVAGPLFDATAVAAVLCVFGGLIIGDAKLVPQFPGAWWLITLALTSQVLGWMLITISLPRLPAAMTSLLLTIQPVGSVALAALILAESPSGLQLAGVAMVLSALLVATRPTRATRRSRRSGELAQPAGAE